MAFEADLIQHNVARNCKLRRVQKAGKVYRTVSEQDYESILNHLVEQGQIADAALLGVWYNTGWRPHCAARDLKWSGVDFDALRVTLDETKTDRQRQRNDPDVQAQGSVKVIDGRTAELLKRWRQLHEAQALGADLRARDEFGEELPDIDLADYVWPVTNRSKEGVWMSAKRFGNIQQSALGKGVCSPKDFRRTLAKRALDRTGSLEAAAAALDHSEPRNTQIYYTGGENGTEGAAERVLRELCGGADTDAVQVAREALQALSPADRAMLFSEFGFAAAVNDDAQLAVA